MQRSVFLPDRIVVAAGSELPAVLLPWALVPQLVAGPHLEDDLVVNSGQVTVPIRNGDVQLAAGVDAVPLPAIQGG